MPILGYLGVALAGLALGLYVTRGVPLAVRVAVPALLVAVVFVPWNGIHLGGYVVGLVGEPSATTLVLLAVASMGMMGWRGGGDVRELSGVLAAVMVGAIVLYPFALGLSARDTYPFGYEPRGLLVAVALLCVASGIAGRWLVVVCVSSAVVLHRLGVGESENLWDYLLDPWVSLWSLYAAARLLRFTIFAPSSKSR